MTFDLQNKTEFASNPNCAGRLVARVAISIVSTLSVCTRERVATVDVRTPRPHCSILKESVNHKSSILPPIEACLELEMSDMAFIRRSLCWITLCSLRLALLRRLGLLIFRTALLSTMTDTYGLLVIASTSSLIAKDR